MGGGLLHNIASLVYPVSTSDPFPDITILASWLPFDDKNKYASKSLQFNLLRKNALWMLVIKRNNHAWDKIEWCTKKTFTLWPWLSEQTSTISSIIILIALLICVILSVNICWNEKETIWKFDVITVYWNFPSVNVNFKNAVIQLSKCRSFFQ